MASAKPVFRAHSKPITPETLSITNHNNSYKMKVELLGLLGKQHAIRILLILRSHGPHRFSDLQKTTGLNPAQLDRALKLLRKDLWAIPETQPTPEGPVYVQYRISNRGQALLKALDGFRSSLNRQKSVIGKDLINEFEALYA